MCEDVRFSQYAFVVLFCTVSNHTQHSNLSPSHFLLSFTNAHIHSSLYTYVRMCVWEKVLSSCVAVECASPNTHINTRQLTVIHSASWRLQLTMIAWPPQKSFGPRLFLCNRRRKVNADLRGLETLQLRITQDSCLWVSLKEDVYDNKRKQKERAGANRK